MGYTKAKLHIKQFPVTNIKLNTTTKRKQKNINKGIIHIEI